MPVADFEVLALENGEMGFGVRRKCPDTAQDCYIESQQTFTSMFEDQAKYNAIMHALGALVYREMRATL